MSTLQVPGRAARDYADKLTRFHAFAAAELAQIAAALSLEPGMRVLDAGCGTGEMLRRFHERLGGTGLVIGLDLSQAHTRHARAHAPRATHKHRQRRALKSASAHFAEAVGVQAVWHTEAAQ